MSDQRHVPHRAVILAGLLGLALVCTGRADDDPLVKTRQLAGEALGRGEYREAEDLYKEVIRRKNGQQDMTLGWSRFGLGKVYSELGRYGESREQFQLSAKVFEAAGADRETRAKVRNSLGYVLTEMGLYGEAGSSLTEAESLFPEDAYTERVVLRLNQARLARRLGQYEEAEKLLLRVVKFYDRADQQKNPAGKVNQGYALNALANVYVDWGKDTEAETTFEQGLKHWKSLGTGKPALVGEGSAHSNRGYFYQRRKKPDPDAAEREYTQAVTLLTEGTAEGDLRAAQAKVNLGWLRYLKGDYAGAEKLFQDSRDARLARWKDTSPDHPELVLSRYNLALAQAAQGRLVAAAREMEEARRSTRRFLANEMPSLGEPAQLDFLKRQRDDWNAVLSLGAADPRVAAFAAGWILNHKGITLDSAPTRKAAKDRIDPWVDLRDVRRTLAKGTILVEIANFRNWNLRPRNGQNPEQASRYVAWLIPADGEGDVTVVPLGGADAGDRIDTLVQSALKEMDRTPERLAGEDKERGAEQKLAAELGELSKLLLEPIRKHVRKGDHLVLSPDSMLWQVPWNALPLTGVVAPRTLNGVAYAIEHHPISYVTSGRDLLRPPARVEPGQSVVLAGLDYRKAPGRTIQIPTDGDPIDADPFRRLRASADEGRAAAAALKKYTGTAPVEAGENQVTADFLKKLRQPRVLFVSTHGYSLASKDSELTRRPLARTGLALSGANESMKNIATGEAIREMDLAGTELVMLSACETARGKVLADAQGTRSLRQAFHQAGARSVIAAGWSVPDTETAEVMKRFFAKLTDKGGKMAALRQAQLDFLAARRADVGVAHPFYWAGFTLSGDWD